MSQINDQLPGRLVFGTVLRNAPVRQGGDVVLIDWRSKSEIARATVYPDNPAMDDDPNPRGNTRGCKGISFIDGEVIAADFHTLRFYDLALNLGRTISHGLMVGTHEIFSADQEHMWISSTVIDGAIEYDLATGQPRSMFFPREMPEFQEALSLEPGHIDVEADNRRRFLTGDHLKSASHLHLNAVSVHRDEVYALFHAQGAICNLTAGNVVIRDKNLIRAHNIVFLDDELLAVNDTYRRTVRLYDIGSGREVRSFDVSKYPWVRAIRRRAELVNLPRKVLRRLRLTDEAISRPLFLRGLARWHDLLFVGMSPASILCINWRTGEFVDGFSYSMDPRACVHGLAVIPDPGE